MKELSENHYKDFWQGGKNKAIRLFYYSQRGLVLANEFRYLFIAILGVYYAMRLSNPVWLVIMFSVAVPLLIIIGWVSVHHISKVVDFLNIRFSTHYSLYQYELLENQLKELKEIKEKINESSLKQNN